jgi:uncharacterized protein DUF1259
MSRIAPCPILLVLLLAACTAATAQDKPQASDWTAVGDILGKPGKVLPDGTFRIDVARTDPPLKNEFGFVVPPSSVLTYAAFCGTPADATVVGDTCSLGEEINPVIDALRAGGIEIVAIHNHMLGGSPNFVFLHFQGRGDAAALAKCVRSAWDQLGKKHPQPDRKPGEAPKLDGKAISEALGLPGAAQVDGMYKIGLPRAHLRPTLDGRALPPAAGPACWVGFAPCECGLTMVMGDTCLLRTELQNAIDDYRRHGIRIVAIHNHALATEPELIFCHFAGEGDALELARGVRDVWTPLMAPK